MMTVECIYVSRSHCLGSVTVDTYIFCLGVLFVDYLLGRLGPQSAWLPIQW